MYRAVELTHSDRDLHRFVLEIRSQSTPQRLSHDLENQLHLSLQTWLWSINHATRYPLPAQAIEKSFYVDDCFTEANSKRRSNWAANPVARPFHTWWFPVKKMELKWPYCTWSPPSWAKIVQPTQQLPDYTKTLGIQWNAHMDHFHLTVSKLPATNDVTNRMLVSDIAKAFEVLGWFSPSTIKVKILLQQLWELDSGLGYSNTSSNTQCLVTVAVQASPTCRKHIPGCYYKESVTFTELHGFCNASERPIER